jgi:5'-3' exonuclease
MPPPSLLLVDVNVLGIGAMRQYQYRDLTHRGKETGAILGIVEKLADLAADHPDRVPIAIWDDRCRWREEIYPRYKRHRWETPEQIALLESYLWQAEIARELLTHLGVPQIFAAGFEADDIAGAIARRADPSWRIRLATTDTDWLQGLRDNVDWFSVSTQRVVTLGDLGNPDRVAGGPFLSVDHFIQSKALAGDASDGIPGVRGVGIKTAARIIRDHGSVEALWARHDAGEPLKGVVLQRAAGPEYRAAYQRNLLLMDWRLAPRLDGAVEIVEGAREDAAASHILESLGLPDAPIDSPSLLPAIARPVIEAVRQVISADCADPGAATPGGAER